MSYTPNLKKNGIGREYRGRKPRNFDKRIQEIIDRKVENISKRASEIAVAALKKKKGRPANTSQQLIIEPGEELAIEELYTQNSRKYTPADKIAAATAWMVTGSASKAEAYCGIPYATINVWRKTEWWANLTAQVRKEKSDEMDAMMTGVLHKAIEAIEDRISGGDTVINKQGIQEKVPVKAKDLASITAIVFDKRALGRGDPTSRSEKVSTESRLKTLKEQFEKFSKAKEIDGEVVNESSSEEK